MATPKLQQFPLYHYGWQVMLCDFLDDDPWNRSEAHSSQGFVRRATAATPAHLTTSARRGCVCSPDYRLIWLDTPALSQSVLLVTQPDWSPGAPKRPSAVG